MPLIGHFKHQLGDTVGEACSARGKPEYCFGTLIYGDSMDNAYINPSSLTALRQATKEARLGLW